MSDPLGASGDVPPGDVSLLLEEETYHLIADPELGRRLRRLHEALASDPACGAPPGPPPSCALCAGDLGALGLPYRLAVRCSHEEPR